MSVIGTMLRKKPFTTIDTVRWRIKLVIALVFVRLVSSLSWTPTPKMKQTLISCHETCFACKTANSEWRAGDVSDNAHCKLCNECYEQNAETIVNVKRNIDEQGNTLQGHLDKFIMISNEEIVYPEGCPRPPACPEDYPWPLIKHCPPLKPCSLPRRALEKQTPLEEQSHAYESPIVLAKTFSPISRPTVAWPTTASATSDTPSSTINFMKKSMIRQATSNILPGGDIFLLKQVGKTDTPVGRQRQISQISVPKSSHNNNEDPGKKPHRPKRVGRSGDTTPCLNDTIDPNFFADNNYDDELRDKDQGHAFRPNEFHDVMQTMKYKPLNETEKSEERLEPKDVKQPQPKMNDVLPMSIPETTEATTMETIVEPSVETTVNTMTKPMQTSVKVKTGSVKAKALESQPHYVDYVTFPLNYDETTPLAPPNVQNCCPSCVCSNPMCMMGGCGYGAPQNNYNGPQVAAPSDYPQYLEVDEEFAKVATRTNTHSTVLVGSRRNAVYLGFPNL